MEWTRRGFLKAALAAIPVAATAAIFDPERLLWVPGAKTIFLPSAPNIIRAPFNICPEAWSAVVASDFSRYKDAMDAHEIGGESVVFHGPTPSFYPETKTDSRHRRPVRQTRLEMLADMTGGEKCPFVETIKQKDNNPAWLYEEPITEGAIARNRDRFNEAQGKKIERFREVVPGKEKS